MGGWGATRGTFETEKELHGKIHCVGNLLLFGQKFGDVPLQNSDQESLENRRLSAT